MNVPGTFPLHEPLLLVRLHVPSLPSLKDKATGVFGSFTIVAQDERIIEEINTNRRLRILNVIINYIRMKLNNIQNTIC